MSVSWPYEPGDTSPLLDSLHHHLTSWLRRTLWLEPLPTWRTFEPQALSRPSVPQEPHAPTATAPGPS